MSQQKKNLKRVGRLWKISQGVSGIIDLGFIGERRVLIFENNKRESEISPHYYVYVSEEENNKERDKEQETSGGL